MEFFTRNTPTYKSAASKTKALAQPAKQSWFSTLFGSLFGGSTPVYRTVDGRSVSASSSSGFLSIFSSTPTYKIAPAQDALFDESSIDGEAEASLEASGE